MQLSHRGNKSMSTPRDQVEGTHVGSYRAGVLPVSFTSRRKAKVKQTPASGRQVSGPGRPHWALPWAWGVAGGWSSLPDSPQQDRSRLHGAQQPARTQRETHLFSCS